MSRSLPATDVLPAGTIPLRLLSLDEWCSVFAHLSGSSSATRPTHRAILDQIRGNHCCAVLDTADQPAACGRGVLENHLIGLFDLVTAPSHRGLGYATRLITTLLQQAHAAGAQHAYLQVAASNHAAHRLYTRLGFQEAYPYWYRVAPSSLCLHA
jgi:ribosomal protein S18 acetylase RimI-like enzyme